MLSTLTEVRTWRRVHGAVYHAGGWHCDHVPPAHPHPQPVAGRIAVPGITAEVVGVSDKERELLKVCAARECWLRFHSTPTTHVRAAAALRAQGVELDVEKYRVTRGLPGLSATTKEENLSRRWCEPSLTVHSVQTSATNNSVIPHRAAGAGVELGALIAYARATCNAAHWCATGDVRAWRVQPR